MEKIAVTILLVIAWHFPTTFFVPAGPPNEKGWIIWPFGQQSKPLLDFAQGILAPATPTATQNPTVALAAAGIASLAFLTAMASLWGMVIPSEWFRPATTVGAAASAIAFVIYLGPWALIPLAVDAVVLWGVLVQGWT
jgi:hypothetical protein